MTFVSMPRCRAMTLHSSAGCATPCTANRSERSSDTQLEQSRGPAHRDEAIPDRKPENLHERSREQGRRHVLRFVASVVTQCRVRHRTRNRRRQGAERNQAPLQRRGRHVQSFARGVQPRDERRLPKLRPDPNRASVSAGISTAAAKLLASCSTRLPPVSLASSRCSGGIASQVRR